MTLLAPAWLGLLGLLPIIALLHARRRLRLEVSSVWLMRSLGGDGTGARSATRPPFDPLMLLQMLVVVLVALSLARPAVERYDHVVVLLDVTVESAIGGASLDGDVRAFAARAVHRAEQAGAIITVVAVADVVVPLAVRHVGGARALARVDAIDAMEVRPDWAGAPELLQGVVRSSERTLVVGMTSEGAANAAEASLRNIDSVQRRELEVLQSRQHTIGLEDLELTRQGASWILRGVARWPTDEEVDLPTSVDVVIRFRPHPADDFLDWDQFTLTRRPAGSAPFQGSLELPGPGTVSIGVVGDGGVALGRTEAFEVRDERTEVSILHVGPPNDAVRRAVIAFDTATYERRATLPPDASAFDLVIVDRVRLERHPGTHTLWLGVQPPLGVAPSFDMVDPDPRGWSTSHVLSAGVDWSQLSVFRGKPFPILPSAEVLVQAADGPLLQARTVGYGREVVASFSVIESDWTAQPSFPTFVANVIRWSVIDAGLEVSSPCVVGDACMLSTRPLPHDARLTRFEGDDVTLVPTLFADAQALQSDPWPHRGADLHFWPRRTGVYRLSGTDLNRWFVVERARVTSVAPLPVIPGNATEIATSPGGRPFPWRQTLLIVAASVLLLEGILALIGRIKSPPGEVRTWRWTLVPSNVAFARLRWIPARAVAVVAVILAAAGIGVPTPVPEEYVVAVIDVGVSRAAGTDQVATTFATELSSSAHRDRVATVVTGTDTLLVGGFGEQFVEPSRDEATHVDLELGVMVAAAMIPTQHGRIVVVTDGTETSGNLERTHARLVDWNLAIDVVPYGGMPLGEVLVEEVYAPDRLFAGQSSTLQAIVRSEPRTDAVVRVYRNGVQLVEQGAFFVDGRNRIDVPIEEPQAGSFLYEIEVDVVGDVYRDNNRDGVFVEVLPTPRVGVIGRESGWNTSFVEALAHHGIHAVALDASEAPASLVGTSSVRGWLDFDVVILMNVSALDVTWDQQLDLQEWVRDHGGGLIVLGGENSFGPGGYYLTAMEDILPLATHIPHERSVLAISFVLDRSTSMRQPVGDSTRLDIAKQATVHAVELLNPESQVGVVVFDFGAEVLVPMHDVGDGGRVESLLAPLVPGGGTNIYAGLDAGYRQLDAPDVASSLRHIVLMTDGLTQQVEGFQELVAEIRTAGITVSTAAIGSGADVRLLATIAELGGGSAYATPDFRVFPSILAAEVLMLSDDPIQRTSVYPAWTGDGAEFLDGVMQSLPPVSGYVKTTAKPEANVHMVVGHDDDPLLASWRYGLGRVVAFTSHGVGSWTAPWLTVPEFPLLWAQAVRWTMAPVRGEGAYLLTRRTGDELEIVAEIVGRDAEPVAGAAPWLRVVTESGSRSVPIDQRRDGRYGVTVHVGRPGVVELSLFDGVDADGAREPVATRSTWIGYPWRYKFDSGGFDRLVAAAVATGGSVTSADGYGDRLTRTSVLREGEGAVLWLLFALTLFLVDLVIRYRGRIAVRFLR